MLADSPHCRVHPHPLQVEKVMLPYSKEDPTKYRDYGFVHFRERPSALQAIARAEEDKPAVDGKELSVSRHGMDLNVA
jgi:hypothetical protein